MIPSKLRLTSAYRSHRSIAHLAHPWYAALALLLTVTPLMSAETLTLDQQQGINAGHAACRCGPPQMTPNAKTQSADFISGWIQGCGNAQQEFNDAGGQMRGCFNKPTAQQQSPIASQRGATACDRAETVTSAPLLRYDADNLKPVDIAGKYQCKTRYVDSGMTTCDERYVISAGAYHVDFLYPDVKEAGSYDLDGNCLIFRDQVTMGPKGPFPPLFTLGQFQNDRIAFLHPSPGEKRFEVWIFERTEKARFGKAAAAGGEKPATAEPKATKETPSP